MNIWDKCTPEEKAEFGAEFKNILKEEFDKEVLATIRKTMPQNIAEEILSVQPMPNIDLHEVAKHPLWQSFVDKHSQKNVHLNRISI